MLAALAAPHGGQEEYLLPKLERSLASVLERALVPVQEALSRIETRVRIIAVLVLCSTCAPRHDRHSIHGRPQAALNEYQQRYFI